jgi:hypothetical protein
VPSDVQLHEPWASFLSELDAQLTRSTEVHCLGGFVVSELYGLERPTADVDILDVTKGTDPATLVRMAGRGSELHKRHKVYLDVVTIAAVPEDYESRLLDLLPKRFRNLRLRALERHDLVLAKLARNTDKDIEDLKRIAVNAGLDLDTLRQRYGRELRFQLGRPAEGDATLEFWIEIVEEIRAATREDRA